MNSRNAMAKLKPKPKPKPKPKRLKRSRVENESRLSSDDGMSSEETAPPRRCSEARSKKGKMIQSLVNRRDEMTSQICSQGEVIQSLVNHTNEMTSKIHELLEKRAESDNNQIIVLGKLIENQSCQSKHLEEVTRSLEKVTERLEKLSEGQNDLRKQLELHTNTPRSQWSQEQPPRYRLVFNSNLDETIYKGESIEIHVALVDSNSGQIVKDGPLASATVELVVIDAKFNQNNNQYNWSIEDFRSSIKTKRQGNSSPVNADEQGQSIVSNGQFNLEKGEKHHRDFSIIKNSTNSRFRLGVMVVLKTQERVLEGLSNPFFVRGHDRPNRKKTRVANGNQAQNAQMSNMQNPSCPNSIQAHGNGPVTTPVLGGEYQSLFQRNADVLSTQLATSQQYQAPTMDEDLNRIGLDAIETLLQQQQQHSLLSQSSWGRLRNADSAYTEPSTGQVPQAYRPPNEDHGLNLTHQPMHNGTGTSFNTNQRIFPVRLILDMPSVVPSKHSFSLLDQLMWQPKFKNPGLPTTCLMQERFGSLTTMPKEVMQNRRGRGVLIESLEPDDSDDGRPQKRKLHSKYQLRFVNKVCETYYTLDQIKADEGNLLKVALFDENDTKITSGPLSSASVEVVALHGDFNGDGQDYWTSEEFNRSVVCLCPMPREETLSVLGGDRILVLADGEACLSDAFFQITIFCARTGKFKMGVMLASTQEERVQEGISEPLRVDHHLPGFIPNCSRPGSMIWSLLFLGLLQVQEKWQKLYLLGFLTLPLTVRRL